MPLTITLSEVLSSFLNQSRSDAAYQRLCENLGLKHSADLVHVRLNDLAQQTYIYRSKTQKRFSTLEVNLFSDKKWYRYSQILKVGRIWQLNYEQAKRAHKIFLTKLGVKQLVVLPIFSKKRWWAYVAFGFKTRSEITMDQFGELAQLISLSIERKLIEIELIETTEYYKAEQKKANDQALQTLKLSQVVEGIAEGVVITDSQMMVEYANKAWYDMTSLDKSGVLNQHLAKNFSKDFSIVLEQAIENIHKSESPKRVIWSFFNTQLKPIHIRCLIFPIVLGVQRVYLSLWEDIEDRMRLEKIQTDFISIASHQLNTPLSAIRWFADLLRVEKVGILTVKQKELVDQILLSSDRMTLLVKSLLDISRVESGRIEIKNEQFNLFDQIEHQLTDFRKLIEQKRLKITLETNRRSNFILNSDPRLVELILENLISNAIKYSINGKEIEIALVPEKDKIRLKISDQGLGIPHKQQPLVFTKFFRADNVVLKEVNGNGLGLYLVKQLSDLLKIEINFESFEDKGTTFHLVFNRLGPKRKSGVLI